MKQSIALAILLLVGCTATGAPDTVRIERDVRVACHSWHIAKKAAVIAGLFVPGISSAAIIIGAAVDPVCDGRALAALSDPSTVEWIDKNADGLHRLVNQRLALLDFLQKL